jgi:protein-S-isoprenylcysteine O-methyltransferase Ste14
MVTMFWIMIFIQKATLSTVIYDTRWTLLCFFVSLIGVLVRVYTVGYAAPNTSGRNVITQVADTLNTTGLYSIIRHPLYVGNYFMWLGICMRLHSISIVIVMSLLYWMYYEKIMFTEEEFLRRKFRDTFDNWAKVTPAIFPNLRRWQKNVLPFQLKKVIFKENDGIYAIIIIFFFFDITVLYIVNQYFFYVPLHWIIIMTISTIAYIGVKLIKKNTKTHR